MQDLNEMIDFFLLEKGENIKVNDIEKIALISDVTDKPIYFDDKMIRLKYQIKTGDIIEYNNYKYLIISQIDKDKNSYRARMRKCSYKVAFNWLGNIKWFDSIEESKVFDIDTGKYISVASGNIYITVQYNADTKNITLNQRFYITNQPFKVVGIDKSQEGLIKLNCTLDSVSQDDDVGNNIVDRWKYEITHTYNLSIDNGSAMNVLLNDTAQIIIKVTDNGVEMNAPPALTYYSSDQNIVTVDNTGKLMGVNLGTAIVTCQMTYNSMVKAEIEIIVAETINYNYSIDITGSTTIKLGKSQSYIAKFYDNGTEIYDKSVVWTIRNEDGTTSRAYATITSFTGNGATVKATSVTNYRNKYVILKAALSDNAEIFKEFKIQIKSLV